MEDGRVKMEAKDSHPDLPGDLGRGNPLTDFYSKTQSGKLLRPQSTYPSSKFISDFRKKRRKGDTGLSGKAVWPVKWPVGLRAGDRFKREDFIDRLAELCRSGSWAVFAWALLKAFLPQTIQTTAGRRRGGYFL